MKRKLTPYRQKRNFSKTPEPSGLVPHAKAGHLFVVQKHAASHLHYDFRLELNGVLKSWAVPKGPSVDPTVKRLAVEVEDHPLEYGDFEGIIPEKQYGGGTVMVWDTGEWYPVDESPQKAYKKGDLTFYLKGKKLQGLWKLIKMKKQGDNNWLLMKIKDDEAKSSKKFDILKAEPLSALSGRSMEEIKGDNEAVWSGGKKKINKVIPISIHQDLLKQIANKKKAPLKKIHPELATLVASPPEGDDWLHEIKLDGYRIICYIQNRKVALLTRHQNDWTEKFPIIEKAFKKLTLSDLIIDGELVVLDEEGRSDFQALQNALDMSQQSELYYYVFDLVYYRGYDLKAVPLVDRKKILQQLTKKLPSISRVRYSDHIQGNGKEVYQRACELNLEGIVSKKANSHYIEKRTRDWLKVKCSKRQEFVVGGYTLPRQSRSYFGALLLGYYDDQKNLHYAGRVGTGFTETSLAEVYKLLKKHHQLKNPFVDELHDKSIRWIKPKLVVEVEYKGWTSDGLIRQGAFKGLRFDKEPPEVKKEEEKLLKKSRSEKSNSKNNGVTIEGVLITNPDKILYPKEKITKRDLIEFYIKIADYILPHIINRPLTLVRCPEGVTDECFYQKHITESLPSAIQYVDIKEIETKETESYVYIKNLAGLIGLIQVETLEIHPWGCRIDKIEYPDRIIFDLDPAPNVEWQSVIEAAFEIKKALEQLRLTSFVKTTGGKGLHVVVPMIRKANWKEVMAFTRAFAESFVETNPNLYTAQMSKAKRPGKIFVDYLRNARGATAIAPYSIRAREGAPIATPLRWQELKKLKSANEYTVTNFSTRLAKIKNDPWEDMEKLRQSIPKKLFT